MAKRKVKKQKERRKKPRTVHTINDRTRPRDFEIARADLTNHFLDVIERNHGGF